MYGFTDGIDALNRSGRPSGSQVCAYDGLNRLAQIYHDGTNCATVSYQATKNSGNAVCH